MSNGKPLPAKVLFDDVSYDKETKVFIGTVSWKPLTYEGADIQVYTLEFAPDFSKIKGGSIKSYEKGELRKTFIFGVDHVYTKA